LFAGVDNSVSAERTFAIGAANIGNVGIGGAIIALFPGRSFQISVSALQSAGWVATISSESVVIIASFVGIEHTITASWKDAVDSASIFDVVVVGDSVIALFSNVDDSISANWVHAVGSASVGEICVVATVIALLGGRIIHSASAFLLAFRVAPPSSDVLGDISW